MKTRIICILLVLALAAVGFSACGKTALPAETTANTAAQEDGQNPVMSFVGNYQSDSCTMQVEAQGTDEARITVHWNTDARTYAQWTMTGKLYEQDGGLVMQYTDGVRATVTTDENGAETRADETTGGTGTVWFNSDYSVAWTDDQNEEIDNLVFEWLPTSAQEETADMLLVGTWRGEDRTYTFSSDGSGTRTNGKEDAAVSFRYTVDAADGSIVFRADAEGDTRASFVLTDYAHLTLTFDDGETQELSRAD